jgi:hypothetical protein
MYFIYIYMYQIKNVLYISYIYVYHKKCTLYITYIHRLTALGNYDDYSHNFFLRSNPTNNHQIITKIDRHNTS